MTHEEHTILSNEPHVSFSNELVHEKRMSPSNGPIHEEHVSPSNEPVHEERVPAATTAGRVHEDGESSATWHRYEDMQEGGNDSQGLAPEIGQQLIEVHVIQQISSGSVQRYPDGNTVCGVSVQGDSEQQLHNIPVELADEGNLQCTHSMITRSKAGIYKPKVYFTEMGASRKGGS
ncbi:hypothetical protein V6N11_025465 [Hibiscus sabdariffa]|uniref:Uncharacterized protein n=1 Tax=Hibiscus sabdariffa TaxID=183260 RepID=A0ABR2NJ08_9ROSI